MDLKRTRRAFEGLVGPEHVLWRPEDLQPYGTDATRVQGRAELVVRPGTAGETAAVMKLAHELGVPVTPRGAGTGLSGGAVPAAGGMVLELTRLQELRVDAENLIVRVGPGVVTERLHQWVESMGLFYPPDPASLKSCTIGGNVAESAGGLRGLKYGVTRDYVLAVDAVLADGSPVRFGSATVKGVSGLDAARLLCGSEGVLAVITGVTLKLIPRPQARAALLGVFPDSAAAAEAVSAVIGAGILPATLEIMDRTTLEAVDQFSGLGAGLDPDTQALLLIESDGHPAAVRDESDRIASILSARGVSYRGAVDDEERDRLWAGRRAAFSALARRRPSVALEDITVPRSELAPTMVGLERIAERHGIEIGTFGHAGDGNLHPTMLGDRRDPEEWARIEAAGEDIFQLALDRGGTLTGEHGIGLAKARFLEREFHAPAVEMMRRIKRAWDPAGLLNPGKLFMEEDAAHGA